MTGCNQVGVKGGSSSSLKSGDFRDGGRGPVGCADGLGDGAEVCSLSYATFRAPRRLACFSKLNIFLFHRLLAQLRDMESAFDGFFEKHRLKLHQYQQLLKYEKSFQEVRMCFFLFSLLLLILWPVVLPLVLSLLNQAHVKSLMRVGDRCVYSTQMELCLKHLIAQERELVTSVNTLPQAEQALKKLDLLESSAQVGLFFSGRLLPGSRC